MMLEVDDRLPCATCAAECCGPVPLTAARLSAIQSVVAEMPADEIKRLARQKRKLSDCGFLDVANHRCAIYEARPLLCQAFGKSEVLPCPKAGPLVQLDTRALTEMRLAEEDRSHQVAMLSSSWSW